MAGSVFISRSDAETENFSCELAKNLRRGASYDGNLPHSMENVGGKVAELHMTDLVF